jgi:hypothetical protein
VTRNLGARHRTRRTPVATRGRGARHRLLRLLQLCGLPAERRRRSAMMLAWALSLAAGCGVKAAPRPPLAPHTTRGATTDGGSAADAGTP